VDKKGLKQINRLGNAFPYQKEAIENWSPDMYRKDCDSFASWKYLKCKEGGVSHKHLAIVTCSTDRDDIEDHAFLLVWSVEDECVYGLDNYWRSVEEFDFFRRYGYNFVRIPVHMQDLIAGIADE
jgi:predicted transglutaminase-like cysteine proteinase